MKESTKLTYGYNVKKLWKWLIENPEHSIKDYMNLWSVKTNWNTEAALTAFEKAVGMEIDFEPIEIIIRKRVVPKRDKYGLRPKVIRERLLPWMARLPDMGQQAAYVISEIQFEIGRNISTLLKDTKGGKLLTKGLCINDRLQYNGDNFLNLHGEKVSITKRLFGIISDYIDKNTYETRTDTIFKTFPNNLAGVHELKVRTHWDRLTKIGEMAIGEGKIPENIMLSSKLFRIGCMIDMQEREVPASKIKQITATRNLNILGKYTFVDMT